MLISNIRQKMLPFLMLTATLSCFPAGSTRGLHLTETHEHKGVSKLLDSPEPHAFKEVSSFILENFGVLQLDNLDQVNQEEKVDEFPWWNLKARMKKASAETARLAAKLAETPHAEQYAIASKLTEQEAKTNNENQEPQKTSNIVSVDLLRELQFLNGHNRSILSAISRASTKGGEIATVALVAKSSDNIPVIKARRDFITYLINNNDVLQALKEKLEVIKAAEPLLFSNYRPFKQERLKAIVQGGLIKEFTKKVFKSHEMEQFATQTELVYKPLGSFLISSIAAGYGLIDLAIALKSNGQTLSKTGGYIKDFFIDPLAAFKITLPQNTIAQAATKAGWKKFLEQELPKVTRSPAPAPKNFKDELSAAQQLHQNTERAKWFWNRTNFWHSTIRPHFEGHYFNETSTNRAIFSAVDPTRTLFDAHLQTEAVNHAPVLSLEQFDSQANRPAGIITPSASAPSSGISQKNRADWRRTQTAKHIDIKYSSQERNKIYNKLAILGLAGGAAFIIPQIEMSMKALTENYLDLKNLFDSVHAPYKIYQAAREMHLLLANTQETMNLYPTCVASRAQPWLNFLKLAQSKTFETSFSMFTMPLKDHGKVVQAYQFLTHSQAEIGELIRFYGEIDAYVSMALLLKEFEGTMNNQGTPVRYSAVDFIENSQYPRFEAYHYWNPIFNTTSVVPNEINLGEHGLARNAIVTGANAGGKSGNLKAILTNIILAQTFGIAPSERLKMTVFSNILATLKSNDDAANNKSRFQVEALEMAKVMQIILLTPKNKFTAVFSDELFAGTEVEPAIALSRRLCLSIAGMDNVMYLLATHYKELTKLEVLTNGIFKNLKVEVIKLPDGKLLLPYKLLPGIGGTNIAFDVFIEQLGEIGMKDDYLYDLVMQAKQDQKNFEINNPIKTLGPEGGFTNRKH